MADERITDMVELATLEGADLLEMVDDPAGTPDNVKVTLETLRSHISGRVAFTEKSSGDTTISATSATAVSGVSDLVLAAIAGDVVEIGVNTRWKGAAAFGNLNVSVVLSGTPGTPIYGNGTLGVAGWTGDNADTVPQHNATGSFYYTVQSGDLSGGTITLRLMAWKSGTGNRDLKSDATNPLQFWAKNHGQAL